MRGYGGYGGIWGDMEPMERAARGSQRAPLAPYAPISLHIPSYYINIIYVIYLYVAGNGFLIYGGQLIFIILTSTLVLHCRYCFSMSYAYTLVYTAYIYIYIYMIYERNLCQYQKFGIGIIFFLEQ